MSSASVENGVSRGLPMQVGEDQPRVKVRHLIFDSPHLTVQGISQESPYKTAYQSHKSEITK